jgi:hypothetical protein
MDTISHLESSKYSPSVYSTNIKDSCNLADTNFEQILKSLK